MDLLIDYSARKSAMLYEGNSIRYSLFRHNKEDNCNTFFLITEIIHKYDEFTNTQICNYNTIFYAYIKWIH